jgi:hypothetical protein
LAALREEQFILKFRQGDGEWEVKERFGSWMALFSYSSETAGWFCRHHRASYLEFDHGQGLCWRFEREAN